MAVDLIIKSNNIFSSKPGEDACFAGAIGVKDGRIAVVGSLDQVLAESDGSTRVVDAADKFVCPGFHDSHVHFFISAMDRSPYAVFCEGRGPQDCIEALKQVEDARPRDEFMLCYGWYHPLWDNPVLPNKQMLDEVYPDRPVVLQSGDAHTLWTNSKGLEKFGITKDSVPPEGGIYQKDEDGELTGIIQEAAASNLGPAMFKFSDEEARTGMLQFIKDLNAEGITSVGDVSMMPVPGGDFIQEDLYQALYDEGKMTVRVSMFPTALKDLSRARKLRDMFAGNDTLRSPGLKQFFDGVSSTHTAWLSEPYANARFEGDCGHPTVPADEMREIVMNAAQEGFSVRIHTIGDQAIHTALDIFEEAQAAYGKPQGQNGLEHLENFQSADIDRLKELDICANCQPPHAVLDPDGEERDLGAARAVYMWPFKTYVDKGIKFSFGTDSPVVDINSRNVIYDAVTRQNPDTGYPEGGWQPQERISAAEAIRAYTLGSAIAVNRDDIGTIEEGKLADLVILDTNLVECAPSDILTSKVLATYMGGTCVFEA